jgi:hypothetical protein
VKYFRNRKKKREHAGTPHSVLHTNQIGVKWGRIVITTGVYPAEDHVMVAIR